jgi:hypothetical protein
VLCVDELRHVRIIAFLLLKCVLVGRTCTERLELNIQAPFWNPAHKHVSTTVVYLTIMSEIIVSNAFHLLAYDVLVYANMFTVNHST